MNRLAAPGETMRQHLIDPEICIRCNTCEATCPVGAVTHDDRNYVVDAAKCTECVGAYDTPRCIEVCPVDGCIEVDPEHTETKEQLEAKYAAMH